MALLAQYERELIAKRTNEALAQAKARGMTLGGFRGYIPTTEDRDRAAAAKIQATQRWAYELAPIIAEIRESGVTSARAIARALNQRAFRRLAAEPGRRRKFSASWPRLDPLCSR